jgi:cell division protein FtsL
MRLCSLSLLSSGGCAVNRTDLVTLVLLVFFVVSSTLLVLSFRREARRERAAEAKAQEQHDLDQLNAEYKRLLKSNGQR